MTELKKMDKDEIMERLKEMPLMLTPNEPHWISAKERLPEERKSVLLCESFGVMYVGCLVGKAEDGTAIWRDDSSGLVETYGRTFAWMPLPEPYEGDRKTEPTISKMEQVEDELQTERSVCDTCQWYNSGIPCGIKPSVCKREVKDEPTEAIQGTGDCDHCSRLFVDCDGR